MIKENKYYIYAHSLENNDMLENIFYIGKGTKNRGTQIKNRNNYWTNTVKKNGNKFYTIYIAKQLTEEEALNLEKLYISILGKKNDGGLLCNLTDGGEGISGHKHSEETRKKISCKKLGIKMSESRKKKYSLIFSGSNNPRYGIKMSEHTKELISNANKGKLKYELHPKWAGFVLQKDKNNNIINIYKTSSEAELLTGIKQSGIRNAINGHTKSAGGYFWERTAKKL